MNIHRKQMLGLACVSFSLLLQNNVFAENINRLTLEDARRQALDHSPLIHAADAEALAAHERVKQQRADYLPQLSADVTRVKTDQSATDVQHDGKTSHLNSYITAGSLNTSTLLDRTAAGIQVRQLITDFGKTGDLLDSAKAAYQSSLDNSKSLRAKILLEVTAAYLGTLQAHALLDVAEKTAHDRQLELDKISLLAQNQLKSQLDVSFATVALKQSEMLKLQAQNNFHAAKAQLAFIMGNRAQDAEFDLAEENLTADPPPQDFSVLLTQALNARPELAQQRAAYDAAVADAHAQQAANYPTVNFLAAAGDTFSGDNRIPDNYAAAGININIPLFAGGKYNAATHRAEFQATAALDKLTDLENQVGRDVRIAWQNSLAGYEALSVSHELATYAEKSLSLAQSRYNLGLSSIVELNNAQLNAVDAEFQDVKTRYQYKLQMTQLDYETGVLQ